MPRFRQILTTPAESFFADNLSYDFLMSPKLEKKLEKSDILVYEIKEF